MRKRTVNIVLPLVGLVLLGICQCGAAGPKPSVKSVVASGAKLVRLTGKFRFTEGPAADAKGDVFFTDIPNSRIHKWSVADEKMSVWREDSGGSNGLYFDRNGNLLACEGNRGRLVSITPKGKVTVLADKFNGKRFNKPNDLWIDPSGGVYFTDPVYGRYKVVQGGEHVYYLSPDRKKVTRVINDLTRPNGIIGTPDGKILYVADHGAGKVYRYEINKASVRLPGAGPKQTAAGKLIVVNVRGEKRGKGVPPYVVANRSVKMEQLRKIIKDAVKKNANLKVLIRGDNDALHGNVASAVAACRDAGVAKANIGFDYAPKTKDSRLSAKKLFASLACDGMTLDNEGNVYLTERVVIVYSPAGKEIERINVPQRPANVCFGGADSQTLFITARSSVYTIRMRVKGVRTK
jgi:sugar lactone lactonase YvrE